MNLPILLNAIAAELPLDGSTMLRIGMTNPPYILEHLKEIANVLCHPCVYTFLHVPVQSGSDSILTVSAELMSHYQCYLLFHCEFPIVVTFFSLLKEVQFNV